MMSDEQGKVIRRMSETANGKLLVFELDADGFSLMCQECTIIECGNGSNFDTYKLEPKKSDGHAEYIFGIKDSDTGARTDIGIIRMPWARFDTVSYNWHLQPVRLGIDPANDVQPIIAAKVGKCWFQVHPLVAEKDLIICGNDPSLGGLFD